MMLDWLRGGGGSIGVLKRKMYIDVLLKKSLVLVEQVPGITVDYENGLIAPALYM